MERSRLGSANTNRYKSEITRERIYFTIEMGKFNGSSALALKSSQNSRPNHITATFLGASRGN